MSKKKIMSKKSKKIKKTQTTEKFPKNPEANFATNKNEAKKRFAKTIQYSHNAANGRLGGFKRK